MPARIIPEVDQENKDRYLSLKREGYTDHQIALKMFIGTDTLRKWKYRWGITLRNKPKNDCGISEHEFEIARKNGISRVNVLHRVRLHEWPIEEAITRPVIKGMRDRALCRVGRS